MGAWCEQGKASPRASKSRVSFCMSPLRESVVSGSTLGTQVSESTCIQIQHVAGTGTRVVVPILCHVFRAFSRVCGEWEHGAITGERVPVEGAVC